jgi:hypothetical protein
MQQQNRSGSAQRGRKKSEGVCVGERVAKKFRKLFRNEGDRERERERETERERESLSVCVSGIAPQQHIRHEQQQLKN